MSKKSYDKDHFDSSSYLPWKWDSFEGLCEEEISPTFSLGCTGDLSTRWGGGGLGVSL